VVITMETISAYVVVGLGVSLTIYLSFLLIWHSLGRFLGLIKLGGILVDWTRYRGKCKECRTNNVHTPKIERGSD